MNPFDIELLKDYKAQLREAAMSLVTSEKGLSLPTLSYIFYKQEKLTPEDIQVLLHKDRLRQQQLTGYDIFSGDYRAGDSAWAKNTQNAKGLIQKVNAEAFQLVDEAIIWISKPQGHYPFESSSDPQVFGNVLFNMERSTDFGWAEILIHEAMHQYIFVLTATAAFDEKISWDTPLYSSIRKEQRPLIGVFHGVAAMCAMLNLAHGTLSSAITEHHKEARSLFGMQSEWLATDLKTLEEHHVTSMFSDLGRYFRHTLKLIENA